MVGINFSRNLKEADEVGRVTGCTELTLSGTCLVHWAFETAVSDDLIDINRLEPDDWEQSNWFLWSAILKSVSAWAPGTSFKIETMNVYTILWGLCHAFLKSINNMRFELESIDWSLCLSCVGLHRCCHETLWEEEG